MSNTYIIRHIDGEAIFNILFRLAYDTETFLYYNGVIHALACIQPL